MLDLLLSGQYAVFILILIAIIISLTFHEFGHAASAKYFGDNTAQLQGRLTLNPVAHIDPMGLLMMVMVGFGYAKPVPTNPRNFRSFWASMFVSAAGPGMNLLVAIVSINFFAFGLAQGWGFLQNQGASLFFMYLAQINMVLMLFNLIPLGSMDGHYILPYFLPRRTAQVYVNWNAAYGNLILMGLMLLSLSNIPVFSIIFTIGQTMLPWITFISMR
jgi:Zn-dependent protease